MWLAKAGGPDDTQEVIDFKEVPGWDVWAAMPVCRMPVTNPSAGCRKSGSGCPVLTSAPPSNALAAIWANFNN
jgi:hypothetical protein